MNPIKIAHFCLIFNLCVFLFFFTACQESDSKLYKISEPEPEISTKADSLNTKPLDEQMKVDTLELKLINAGLVNIQNLDSSIRVELKYSTEDNFMEKDVYGTLENAYLQDEVAQSLVECQQYLKSVDSSLTLLVYDAVRPRSVQQYMWDHLDMPISEKVKFVSNPKNGSIHNYGSAIDLTIAKVDGTPLDMGAKYDEIGKIAYPSLEGHFLKSGELSKEQIANRKLLRKVMRYGNFTNIPTEWWHFNRFSRTVAKSKYQIIE